VPGVEGSFAIFALAVVLSYVYAFVGGFTDAANAVATAVGTRALSPTQAVLVAGVFELLGALTGTAVALTVGKGIVEPEVLTQGAVVAALVGAMAWSLLTYRFGIPVSETHALVGGIVGVGLFVGGHEAVQWTSLLPVLVAIIVSPTLGVLGGMLLLILVYHLSWRMQREAGRRLFVNLQRLSSMYMAFSHGRNDAQKPMGVLTLALAVHFGWTTIEVPLWVIVSVAATAGMGVAAGGWRIIRTLGMRVTGLSPVQGFAAETAAASVLQLASELGIPVSTTHTITSAIVGTGVVRGWGMVHWEVVWQIALSWVLTLPVTIGLGYLAAAALAALLGSR
jgi:PiT family inorganic phosphate transporter